jgi:cytochrome P450
LRRLISIGKSEKTGDCSKILIQGLLLSRNKEAASGSSKGTGLTELVIIGNMFTIAGHETTATSLRFTLLFLALHPDVQDCLHEGILEPTRGEPEDVAHWDYHRMFPKLITRVMVCPILVSWHTILT